jgi:hypothetical protein
MCTSPPNNMSLIDYCVGGPTVVYIVYPADGKPCVQVSLVVLYSTCSGEAAYYPGSRITQLSKSGSVLLRIFIRISDSEESISENFILMNRSSFGWF